MDNSSGKKKRRGRAENAEQGRVLVSGPDGTKGAAL